MADIRIGGASPAAIYYGERRVRAVYYGAIRLWPLTLTIRAPTGAAVWTDFAPGVLTGVNLAMPTDGVDWSDFAPNVELSVIPADVMDWLDYAPVIAAGAHLSIPADGVEWADFTPSITIPVVVRPPADAMEWADYAPVVVSGASVEVASDEAVWDDYAPSVVSGVNLAVPVSIMDWRDFGVVSGYGFSTGFNSGFTAIPGASGAAVPTDSMVLADFAPDIDAATQIGFAFIGGDTELTDRDIGAAVEDRYIFALVYGSRLGNTSLVSATIGGVTAKIHVQRTMNTNGPVYRNVALISALVPTGTTADIVPTYSATTDNYNGAAVYRVTGLVSDDALDTSSSTIDGTRTWNRSLATPAGGFVVAGGDLFGGDPDLYSLDMTLDYQDQLERHCAFSSIEAAADASKTFRFRNGDENHICIGPFIMASFR